MGIERPERYQRPYPGYAFEFGNIDSYTQTRSKLSPIKDTNVVNIQASNLQTNRDSIACDEHGDSLDEADGIDAAIDNTQSFFKMSSLQ